MLRKKWLITIVLITAGHMLSEAQVTRTEGMLDLSNDMSHTLVAEIPFERKPDKGTHYFFDDWHQGQIEMIDGRSVKSPLMRFDVENNNLEIRFGGKVRVLSGRKVKEFFLISGDRKTYFIDAGSYSIENAPMYGFFEVLVNGKNKLFSRTSITIKQANYNVALDMGSEQNEIVKVETLYMFADDQLHKLTKSKKKTLSLFDSKSKQVEQFSKTKRLGYKKKEDLIEIVNYYNTI
ncbi:hypothetical protein QQ020_15705 [Fulvivirgaceae bacterium BMA12]|uniref:Uncharacterized protein n=1 Tax=Agaribacillus aureus TaxID=3051825 RepID=A0ABT8LAW0_9BACT|nr:hypothetical protein [Fulvivirgaceae bacterium BMA12]